MNHPPPPDEVTQLTRKIANVSIRLGILFALVYFSFLVVRPFVGAIVSGGILAIALFPLFVRISGRSGGRPKTVGILFIVLSIALIMVPSFLLFTESFERVQHVAGQLEAGEIQLPPPSEKVKEWPMIGDKIYSLWEDAEKDLHGIATRFSPQVKAFGKGTLGLLSGFGGQLLSLTFAFVLAGVFMINGESCTRFFRKLFNKLSIIEGEHVLELATKSIRSVTLGVVGVACIQSFMAAAGLWLMGIPLTGLWVGLVLICAVCQLPPLLVLGPVAAFSYTTHDPVVASIFLVWCILITLSDGFLKPLLLGRGVDVPMLVILIGAIGGVIFAGIVGLFVGAVVLAVTYKHVVVWMARERDDESKTIEERT